MGAECVHVAIGHGGQVAMLHGVIWGECMLGHQMWRVGSSICVVGYRGSAIEGWVVLHGGI
jgi:hypothetical protein